MSKKRKKGGGQIGGYRPHTKLTKEQVLEIWGLLHEGNLSQGEIAVLFNVGQEAISHIATGTRWNSVTGLPRRTKLSTTPPPSGVLQGRPRTSRKVSLRKAKRKEMKALADVCIRAILNSQQYIVVKLPFLFKASASWPKTTVLEANYDYKICKIVSKKLLAWLYENKYTNVSVTQVERVIKDFGLFAALSANGLSGDLLKDLI